MRKGIWYTLISALLYGFTPVLGYITYAMGNDAITLTFFRNLLTLPVLLFLVFKYKISMKLTLKQFFQMLCISILGQFASTILLYSSYSYIGVGTSTTLHFLYPLFILIASKFFYKDKVTFNQVVSMVVSLIGIIMFIELKDLKVLLGIGYALTSGVAYGIFILFTDKWNLSRMDSYKFSLTISLMITFFMILINGTIININFSMDWITYAIMFVIAMMASFVGVIFLKKGIEILGSQLASVICLVEPVSAMIFGIVLLKDSILITRFIGVFLILFSMLILSRPRMFSGLFTER